MRTPLVVGSFLALTTAAALIATPSPVPFQSGAPEQPAPGAPDGAPADAAPGKRGANDLPPFAEVSKGFEKVTSSPDGASLFQLYMNRKEEQLLAELPKGWDRMKFFIAATPAGGVIFSGLQGPARYVFWRQYGNRLALVEPQIGVRSTGEQTSKDSVKRIFTDRVLFDVPIVANGPTGMPVIDLDAVLIGQSAQLAGINLNQRLAKIAKAKSFPQNLELAIEAPDQSGNYKTVHYSISVIPDSTSYRPRVADDRVGYFLTDYRDLGQYGTETNWVRYINRWDLQKRDPKLTISPAKEPIVFYVEHTVPVRYRRYVRDGILQWNEAFRRVGIDNAIEVNQQDEVTGAHMDKDPEDCRYNFVRWLNNDVATAIGPSRANPLTGQILDADIVLTDGWIRAFYNWYDERPLDMAMSLSASTLIWLEQHPDWDPRLQMLPPLDREAEMQNRSARAAAGDPDPADSRKDSLLVGRPEFDEALQMLSANSKHGAPAHACGAQCFAAQGLAMDMAFANMQMEMLGLIGDVGRDAPKDEDAPKNPTDPKDPKEGDPKPTAPSTPKEDILDGVPESFVSVQLAHLIAHEVGHTLGLRHNFKASSLYTLKEINSPEIKGKKPYAASVMDYIGTNFNVDPEAVQGDFAMTGIGIYDLWAIEYGYTFDDPTKVVARVGEPGHMYLTDEDTGGPDPLARRYDFSKDPHEWANASIELCNKLRGNLLEKYVKDGDSWERVRKGYQKTLNKQRQMIDMMGGWVGGTHVNRVKKGDANTGDPLVPCDPAMQRAALKFVIEHAFRDEAYGLSPDLVNKMSLEKWGGPGQSQSAWPINDQVSATQSLALTLLVNPEVLSRVLDNEARTKPGEDALTLPELMKSLNEEIYKELGNGTRGSYSDRNPMITQFRRNLQADYTDRLIRIGTGNAAMPRTVRQQALYQLEQLKVKLDGAVKAGGLDGYSAPHLSDMQKRVQKALDAVYLAQ
ncbi:MAG: zinc-dependent metalloprotease [Phycisphaerae bacterium]|nr:zinc-dependent metalloprotease [Phycisphaerae bacterium]